MPVSLFLRQSQTEPTTGGTVYDLGTSADTGTIAVSGTANVLTEFARWVRSLPDTERPAGTTSIPYELSIASQAANTESRVVIARLNSSGTIQQSFNGATYTGTAATVLSGTATLSGFVAGDLVAVIVENRRTSGGGARTTTVDTTSASFIEVTPAPLGIAANLSVTATAGSATGEAPNPLANGVAANLSVTATVGVVEGKTPPALPGPPPPPSQGGKPVIEIGFVLNANLQQIAGENPPFTLDDPVLGELDSYIAELPGGDVWIDVSEYFIDGLEISRGRNRSVDLLRAGTAAFRLDNRLRTFDPTNVLSPFFGNLTPMRPVRISFDGIGGRVTVFQGFVTDWQLRYGRPVDAWVEVTCADAFILFAADVIDEEALPVGDGDTADVRIGRVLDLVGFGPQRDLTVGTFPLEETLFGVNALVHMQEAAASDSGFLFVARDGVLTYRTPSAVSASGVSVTFGQNNTTSGAVRYHDVELTSSTELLFNTVSVNWAGGTATEVDTSSRDKYLPRTLSIKTLLRDEADAILLAEFGLVRYAEPELRFRNVQIKVHDRRISAAQRRLLCRLDVGSVVEVFRRPPGPGSQVAFTQVVEGLRWVYARDAWQLDLQLGDVLSAPFTLDDLTLGLLDTGGVLTF